MPLLVSDNRGHVGARDGVAQIGAERKRHRDDRISGESQELSLEVVALLLDAGASVLARSRTRQPDPAGGAAAQPSELAFAPTAPGRPRACGTPARSQGPRTSRTAAPAAHGCAPHTPSRSAQARAPSPSGESTASRSRSSPDSRSTP